MAGPILVYWCGRCLRYVSRSWPTFGQQQRCPKCKQYMRQVDANRFLKKVNERLAFGEPDEDEYETEGGTATDT